MNYYNFHIGDYASATRHLTWEEDLAYRRLLDAYYTREEPIPSDRRQAYRLVLASTNEQREAVDAVLDEFFTLSDDGETYFHERCDAEIAIAKDKKSKASNSAKKRWSNAKDQSAALPTESEGIANASIQPCERIEITCEGNAPNPNPNPNSKPTAVAEATLACPVEEIVALYHEAMPSNPRCKVLNPARRGAIKARWREAARLSCDPFGYKTEEQGLQAWRAFFDICAQSQFLTGKTKPQPGKPPFVASIDFLMAPESFAKCLENFYHREAA